MVGFEADQLESRVLFSSAFDLTGLTTLRSSAQYSNINGSGIGIAVLDTGVYAQNPDLKNNFVAFYNAVDNPVTTPPDTNPQDAFDNDGHGTHTSGTAASSNPNIGVADGAKLIDVRVLSDTGEAVLPGDPIDRGLQWVAQYASQYNIKVVNMSLGYPVNLNYVPNLDQEGYDIQTLEGMGITVVSASGNSYAQYVTPGASLPAVESTVSVGNVFSDNGVGQYDFTEYFGGQGDTWFARQPSAGPDVFNATSQRSTLFNQVVAPGTDILSTWNSAAQPYNTLSGTSMASPFVAGTVALMQQTAAQYGGTSLTPTAVLQILRNTSVQITDPINSPNVRAEIQANGLLGPDQPLAGTGLTYDRVNVYAAIQATEAYVLGNTGIGSDLNNTLATATATAPLNGELNLDVIGNIGSDGSVLIGNDDVDLYKVTLAVEGDLSITILPVANGTNFNSTLRLFDSTGAEIGFSTSQNGTNPAFATPIGQPLPIGTYYIGISSAGNDTYDPTNGSGIGGGAGQGDYELRAIMNLPDPHGVPAVGDALNLYSPNTLLPTANYGDVPSTSLTGIIGQETAPNGTIVNYVNGDVHFYQMVAPDTGVMFVQAEADPTLDPGASVVSEVFDSSYNSLGIAASNQNISVTAGQTYYIGVTTQADTDFVTNTFDPINPYNRQVNSTPLTPYDLFVAFTNGDRNGSVAQATPSTVGTAINQQIGTDNGAAILGANGGNKDADFYAFTAPTSGVFEATVSGSGGLTPAMTLWNTTSGVTGVQRLEDAPQGSLQLYQQVTAGQIIVVSITGLGNQNMNGMALGSGAGGQTGTYTLNTSIQPASLLTTLSNNSILSATPTPLTLNNPTAANLGLDGTLYLGPSDIDMYSFVAPATEEYQFATNTSQDSSAQTVLRVFDANGNQIAVNQSVSTTSTNSVVDVPTTAGQTYYIGVSGVGPQAYTYNPLTGAATGTGKKGPYTIAATDAGPFQSTLSFGQGQVARFTDANGHKVTVSLTGPGRGEVIFLSTTTAGNVSQIQVNGSDKSSSLVVRGATSLPSVLVNGSLGSLNARQSDLTGDLTVTGGLNNLTLGTASGGHSITVGTGGRLNLNVGTLTDESLVSSEPVGTIRANQWTVSGTSRQQITAPSIQTINVRGTFDEDVTATTLGTLSVGSLASSAIRIQASINSVNAGAASDSEIFVNVTPTLTTLPTSPSDFVSESGTLRAVRVRGAFSNTQIAAWTTGTVTLNALQPSNGGTPFGLTANRVSHLRVTPAGAKPIVLSNVFAPYPATSLGGDATLRVIG